MKSRFSRVIVLGCGTAAVNVLEYVSKKQYEYDLNVCFIEHEVNPLSRLKKLCKEHKVDYELIPDKMKVTTALSNLTESTLIISAGNYYLFPRAVIEQSQVEIINFHNALLPKIPGRNATTWAIWLGETVSGATWHYVAPGIDDGAIIAQEIVPITEDCKAWELSRDITSAANRAFIGFFEDLLVKHIPGKSQRIENASRKVYYSREMPLDGVCTTAMPGQEIYRLLRAMDYGKSSVFPPVKIILPDGATAVVKRYARIEQENAGSNSDGRLYLPLSDGYCLRIRYERVNGD